MWSKKSAYIKIRQPLNDDYRIDEDCFPSKGIIYGDVAVLADQVLQEEQLMALG